ncbi:MAG: hypothetical protein WD080_09675 [Egibacteraceae bacterium]
MSDDVRYPVRTASGRELTEQDVEQLADEFERDDVPARVVGRLGDVRRGRPSLTGRAAASPRVSFRTTDDLRARAEDRATREGKTVSQVAREALESYLDAG